MRWTTELEDHVLSKLADGRCPLCGGAVRPRVFVEWPGGPEVGEMACRGCGAIVGDSGRVTQLRVVD